MLVGKRDLIGESRVRERDKGAGGSSTLNRLELIKRQRRTATRRLRGDSEAIDGLLVDLFIESHTKPPREIWLDLDATDDPLYGQQEGRFTCRSIQVDSSGDVFYVLGLARNSRLVRAIGEALPSLHRRKRVIRDFASRQCGRTDPDRWSDLCHLDVHL